MFFQNRVALLVLCLISLPLILLGCSKQDSRDSNNRAAQAKPNINVKNLQEFTPGELAKYDGSDGKPAYVAVNGIIYDVTDAETWSKGIHYPWSSFKRLAGHDITKELKKAPPSHQKKGFLNNFPVVGQLKD